MMELWFEREFNDFIIESDLRIEEFYLNFYILSIRKFKEFYLVFLWLLICEYDSHGGSPFV